MSATRSLEGAQRRPLHRTEYEALGRLGAFDDQNVELLDGEIVYAAEEGPGHASIRTRLARLLIEAIPAGEGEVRVVSPLAVSQWSEPEPDFAVIAPPPAHRAAHPRWATLVIEVAETSRSRDLGPKAALYAAAGVPDYWVIDVARAAIVVHRQPQGTAFASVTTHHQGIVRALTHPGVAVDVVALAG